MKNYNNAKTNEAGSMQNQKSNEELTKPYSIQNGIFLDGNVEEIIKLRQFIQGPDSPQEQTKPLDFKRIIPMPKTIRLGLNSSQDQINRHDKWCYENLGCILDINNLTWDGFDKMHFGTINGSGLKVIKELSKLFPTIKIYFAARYDYREYCCFIFEGVVLKSNYAIDDQNDGALVNFFNINLSVDAAFDATFDKLCFDKFCNSSKLDMEYPPEDCLYEDPIIDENDEPDNPIESSYINDEIRKIINCC